MSDNEVQEKKSRGGRVAKKPEAEKAPAQAAATKRKNTDSGDEPASKRGRGRPKGATKKKTSKGAGGKKRGRKPKDAKESKAAAQKDDSNSE